MAKNGNDILVYMNGLPVAGARSAEVRVDGELVEVAAATQGDWREFMAGRKEWDVQVSHLVLANADIQKLITVNQKVTLLIKGRNDANTAGLTGQAFIQNAKQTYTKGALVQGAFTFKGTGPLYQPT